MPGERSTGAGAGSDGGPDGSLGGAPRGMAATGVAAGTDAFVRPLSTGDQTIGGKARSVARLATLGLPVPPGFAVTTSLFEAILAKGPAAPSGLRTAADLAALDAAREAIEGASFPAAAEAQLRHAVDLLTAAVAPMNDAASSGPAAGGQSPVLLSVRSSAATEDRPGALGAGVFRSVLRVPPSEVAGAVRRVMASYLAPAAWAYAHERGGAGIAPSFDANEAAHGQAIGGGVLVHVFVPGDAMGTAALDPAAALAGGEGHEHNSNSNSDSDTDTDSHGDRYTDTGRDDASVWIHASHGHPTAGARKVIAAALRLAAAAHGPVELEWVARGAEVTFLQLRGYQGAPSPTVATVAARTSGVPGPPGESARTAAAFTAAMDPGQTGGPWTWDAAHNPWPLSPAQAGLVELVDGRCRIGMRQRIVDGYLFYRREADAITPAEELASLSVSAIHGGGGRARPELERVCAAVLPAIEHLGDAPALEDALHLYLSAYEPLFGVVGRAAATARQTLAVWLKERFPEEPSALSILLSDVPSVASRRRSAARAIVFANGAPDRQRAIDAYLAEFGDESPRWDVAESTLRENPERLVLLAAARSANSPEIDAADHGRADHDRADHEPASDAATKRSPRTTGARPSAPTADLAWRRTLATLSARLPPMERNELAAMTAAAREAVAVGEDDDALFARLQACIRRALLTVAARLVATHRLDDASDVFYLPLAMVRSLAGGGEATSDLRTIAALARSVFESVRLSPPPLQSVAAVAADHCDATVDGGVGARTTVKGVGGSGGRAIGRAVHHPTPAPLTEDMVLVAVTLLPTELPLLHPGAIVVETGSALDHVAAQARERNIPALVGAPGACAAIPEGAMVIVDGDRGEAVVVG